MAKLALILVVLFAALALLVKLLEGRAAPLSAEQQQRLWRWIAVLVFVSLILAFLQQWLGGHAG